MIPTASIKSAPDYLIFRLLGLFEPKPTLSNAYPGDNLINKHNSYFIIQELKGAQMHFLTLGKSTRIISIGHSFTRVSGRLDKAAKTDSSAVRMVSNRTAPGYK